MQFYIEYIIAIQQKYAKEGFDIPLCIMTSNDTNARTVRLLERNNYFGLKSSQVSIVQQGQGVAALANNEGTLAKDPDDEYKVLTKPHGHGDIHSLLHRHGVAAKWLSYGVKYMVMFQDTNGLAFHTLPLMLGVSEQLGLIMNSLAVPRKAKQAIGGIAKLTHKKTGAERTINVEYNQLDPLLRATGHKDGDVNNERTGFSPFPGNINQLLFNLKDYCRILERTKGIMPEFVNPKYKDGYKMVFKKPTRMECMMQDFPTVLEGEDTKKVGFTSVSADLCFSPVKNATEDGVALQAKGVAPGVASSGEADQYHAWRKIMRKLGCQIAVGDLTTYRGVKVTLGPAIVLKPSFALCPGECRVKFPYPERVKISARSTLIVRGNGVIIESLELDGALVVDCSYGETIVIRDRVIKNKGWEFVADEYSDNEVIRMRGYRIVRKQTQVIEVPFEACSLM